jgi:hypothetical protein
MNCAHKHQRCPICARENCTHVDFGIVMAAFQVGFVAKREAWNFSLQLVNNTLEKTPKPGEFFMGYAVDNEYRLTYEDVCAQDWIIYRKFVYFSA